MDEFSEAAKGIISLLEKYFTQETNENQNDSQTPGNTIAVLFIPSKYLRHYEVLKQVAAFSSTKRILDRKDIPLITISYKDIMLNREPKKDIYDYWNPPDPRHRFLDSSIWYRYVPLETVTEFDGSTQTFTDHLQAALETISWAYQHNLYKKSISWEYKEYQVRLLLNSYLSRDADGDHASRVFPDIFHSETVFERKATRLYHELTKNDFQWNFLLIDDYAGKELRDRENQKKANAVLPNKTGETKKDLYKGEIIQNLIQYGLNAPSGDSKKVIDQFDWAESVDAAITCIKNGKCVKEEENAEEKASVIYDVILLDYLFSQDGDIHYGTTFLKAIAGKAQDRNGNDLPKLTEGKGILDTYWIHPISAFPDAMRADLQSEGHYHFEESWQMTRGADAINSPHLFRCSLLGFMKAQTQRVVWGTEELFLTMTRTPCPPKNVETPAWAREQFRRLMEKFSTIEGLPVGSSLGDSIQRYLGEFMGEILRIMQHYRQLLYLLGYTQGFDRESIEFEYQAILFHYAQFKGNTNKDGTSFIELEKLLPKVAKQLESIGKQIYSK